MFDVCLHHHMGVLRKGVILFVIAQECVTAATALQYTLLGLTCHIATSGVK